MKADLERAASAAAKTIETYGQLCPMSILKKLPGVLVTSYSETSESVGTDRENLLKMFGERDQDAFTTACIRNGKTKYLIMYNKQMTCLETRNALARELGHIILGHDGTRPESVRNEEAACFAKHLLEGFES